jgi:hypothetical protein
MHSTGGASRSFVPTLAGTGVGLAGLGLVAAGLWARREAKRALAEERVAGLSDETPGAVVASAAEARALAELIRRNTLESTGGRTYAEVDAYLDPEGKPTPDAAAAGKDERTGQPIENPDHDLWLQSITLQSALMQAYVGFRLSELIVAVGASFTMVGLGLAAAGRLGSPRR